MSNPVVEVNNVSVTFNVANERIQSLKEWAIKMVRRELFYKEFVAVDDVSFTVERGDVFGIIGTNGSGKSTLLKVIAGVLQPSKGNCKVHGTIAPLIELGAGFDGELTAHENIFLNGALLGHSRQFMQEHFDEIVEFAELEGFMEMPIKNYSSGMVARIAFAIATMSEPDLLIVDEVLSVGDFMFQKKCEKRISKMIEHGTTVLIVSHSNDQIRRLCTKAMWIEKSKLQMIGDTADVLDAYESMQNGATAEEITGKSGEMQMYFNADRYEVARQAAQENAALLPGPPEGVVVISGEDGAWPEALSAAGLSGVLGYPLVPICGTGLTDANKATLSAYGTNLHIVLVGNTTTITPGVEEQLAEFGTITKRIAGKDHYETNALIFEYGHQLGIWNMENLFVARGDNFPASITIAPYLACMAAPLIITPADTDELPAAQAAIARKAEHVVLLGNEGSISPVIEEEYNASRLAGTGLYGTVAVMVRWELQHGMTLDGGGFATGTAFTDALSATSLLASNKSVLCLAAGEEGLNSPIYRSIHNADSKQLRIFSSTEALPPDIRSSITRAAGWHGFKVTSAK